MAYWLAIALAVVYGLVLVFWWLPVEFALDLICLLLKMGQCTARRSQSAELPLQTGMVYAICLF